MGNSKLQINMIAEIAKNAWSVVALPVVDIFTSEFDLEKCLIDVPLFDETKNLAALNECAEQSGFDVEDKKSCAYECGVEAVGLYWADSAKCVARRAGKSCIDIEVPRKVVAFEVPCLRKCGNNDIHL